MKFLASILIVWFFVDITAAQFFQYFYSSPAPILPQFQAPFYQPQIIPQPQPYFFQPQFYQTQSAERQTERPAVSSVPQIQRNNLATFPAPQNYRGYGYHTELGDGASSTVVFFSGGPNPNVVQPLHEKITVASDSLDPQIPSSIEERLQTIFEENRSSTKSEDTSNASNHLSFPSLTPLIKSFLEHPETLSQVVHFYSEPGYPASTAPLVVSGRSRALNLENRNSTLNITTESLKEETPTESLLASTTLLKVDDNEKSAGAIQPIEENFTSPPSDESNDEVNTEGSIIELSVNSNASAASQKIEAISTEESKSKGSEDENISTTDLSDIETTTVV